MTVGCFVNNKIVNQVAIELAADAIVKLVIVVILIEFSRKPTRI